MPDDDLSGALQRRLRCGVVAELVRLSGGASRETFRFAADGRPLVLQRRRRGDTRSLSVEEQVLRAAHAAGVPVPAVVDADSSPGEIGGAFMVLEAVEGETIARRILRDDEYATARAALVGQLGAALARVHAVDPSGISGLESADQVAQYRLALDALGEPHPAFELAFRWLEQHRPASTRTALVHGDFRLGNVIVGPEGLRAVLDWELAHLGDPMEDLGWLCVKAWRFGAPGEVAGLGSVDELVAAYRQAGGTGADPDTVHWWQVLGTLKWGIMCIMQANAHLSGAVRSHELAAIGRRVCENEHDLFLALEGALVTAPHDRPSAAELVAAVREWLERDLVGRAEGKLGFDARVAANVLSVVERELETGGALAERHAQRLARLGVADDAALAALIRDGSLDARLDEVRALVWESVRDKLSVANPRYLAGPG